LDAAFNLLVYWQSGHHQHITTTEGMAFVNSQSDATEVSSVTMTTTAGRENWAPVDHASILCYCCEQTGHYANKCTNAPVNRHSRFQNCHQQGNSRQNKEGVQMLMDASAEKYSAVTYNMIGQISDGIVNMGSTIPSSWIILDSQSNVDVFTNPTLLQDISETPHSMRITSQAGVLVTNKQGTLPGYGKVWYDPDGIANILSLTNVKKQHHVAYDSRNGDAFVVKTTDGKERKFECGSLCLYFYDTSADQQYVSNVFTTTVAENESKYSKRDVDRAKAARLLQVRLGYPSTTQLKTMLIKQVITNFPVTAKDVQMAEDIYRPCLGNIKGKTMQESSDTVRLTMHPLPVDMPNKYKDVVLAVDVMKINQLPFLVTISRDIKFGMVQPLTNLQNKTIVSGLTQVVQV
jgi:hypothetical protein